jgi:hypothetical protein
VRNPFTALVVLGTILGSQLALAGRCQIFNDTGASFTVESGSTSNQRVGAHTHTTIDSGRIIAKSDDGKGLGGSCRDGEKVKIVLERGVYMIVPN